MLAIATTVALVAPAGDRRLGSPSLWFTLVTLGALCCIVAATCVIVIADRRRTAELGLLGAVLMAASVMPMVHGLVTPGVLFEDTAAFRTSSFLTLPVGLFVGLPLIVPRTSFGRWASRHWRDWTLMALIGVFALAALVVFVPDVIRSPGGRNPVTLVASLCVVSVLGLISRRQLRLYALGRHRAHLVASIAFVMLAAYGLVPVATPVYGVGFWWLHFAGALGVIGASVGLAVTKSMSNTAHDVLGPVLQRDPLAAFELGLSPLVHGFVADLETKDELTRDHVVRTCELAMRVGERLRLSPSEVRNLGLAALLHDVGKVNIPDHIVQNTGVLSEEDFDIVKRHTIDGEEMLRSDPSLATAATIVRSHHERVDGTGYPDGLAGVDIPIESRIIAACDALDAMTHDQPHRSSMSLAMAFGVLREHAGSQWDMVVVEHVISARATLASLEAFDEVGRAVDLDAQIATAWPEMDDLLATVEADI